MSLLASVIISTSNQYIRLIGKWEIEDDGKMHNGLFETKEHG